MPAACQNWKLLDPDVMTWHEWGEECVLFNGASGDTHLLNSLAAYALRTLTTRPATTAVLAERVANKLGIECDVLLSETVERLLRELEGLGLIEPADG